MDTIATQAGRRRSAPRIPVSRMSRAYKPPHVYSGVTRTQRSLVPSLHFPDTSSRWFDLRPAPARPCFTSGRPHTLLKREVLAVSPLFHAQNLRVPGRKTGDLAAMHPALI